MEVTAAVAPVRQANSERSQWHVRVSGAPDIRRFLERVGGLGGRKEAAQRRLEGLLGGGRAANTNRDVVPKAAWLSLVERARRASGMSQREMQLKLGTQFCGSTLYKANLSRERAERVADIVESAELGRLATSEVYWDRIATIEPDGEETVYDLTVDRLHNFVANDIVVHNSIEQDADLVMFVYRDEYYDPESEREGIADLIISKHRNGGLANVELTFQKEYPRFMTYVGPDRYDL